MARKKVVKSESVEETAIKPSIEGEPNGVAEASKITKTTRKRKVKVEQDEDEQSPLPSPKSKEA